MAKVWISNYKDGGRPKEATAGKVSEVLSAEGLTNSGVEVTVNGVSASPDTLLGEGNVVLISQGSVKSGL